MSQGPGGNDQRRRIVRSTICTDWNGVAPLTQQLPNNSGLAQHQIFVAVATKPSSGVVRISVRPAKMAYFVPVGTIDLSITGTGQILLPAILDAVRLDFPTTPLSGSSTVQSGILSIADDFTTSHDQSDVDRRRFGQTVMCLDWDGSKPVSQACADQGGFAQHQFSIAGGSGAVLVFASPAGSGALIDIGLGSIDSSGSLVLFSGMYDNYSIKAKTAVSGSISAQVISVGEEMFFTPLG